ncbi:hypothetical protein B0J17DRAFT_703952 [Rhizoctonia solani]|nr:hypothetical protein B0J17DRAFT_703952 [Rhizoctonia solani]
MSETNGSHKITPSSFYKHFIPNEELPTLKFRRIGRCIIAEASTGLFGGLWKSLSPLSETIKPLRQDPRITFVNNVGHVRDRRRSGGFVYQSHATENTSSGVRVVKTSLYYKDYDIPDVDEIEVVIGLSRRGLNWRVISRAKRRVDILRSGDEAVRAWDSRYYLG